MRERKEIIPFVVDEDMKKANRGEFSSESYASKSKNKQAIGAAVGISAAAVAIPQPSETTNTITIEEAFEHPEDQSHWKSVAESPDDPEQQVERDYLDILQSRPFSIEGMENFTDGLVSDEALTEDISIEISQAPEFISFVNSQKITGIEAAKQLPEDTVFSSDIYLHKEGNEMVASGILKAVTPDGLHVSYLQSNTGRIYPFAMNPDEHISLSYDSDSGNFITVYKLDAFPGQVFTITLDANGEPSTQAVAVPQGIDTESDEAFTILHAANDGEGQKLLDEPKTTASSTPLMGGEITMGGFNRFADTGSEQRYTIIAYQQPDGTFGNFRYIIVPEFESFEIPTNVAINPTETPQVPFRDELMAKTGGERVFSADQFHIEEGFIVDEITGNQYELKSVTMREKGETVERQPGIYNENHPEGADIYGFKLDIGKESRIINGVEHELPSLTILIYDNTNGNITVGKGILAGAINKGVIWVSNGGSTSAVRAVDIQDLNDQVKNGDIIRITLISNEMAQPRSNPNFDGFDSYTSDERKAMSSLYQDVLNNSLDLHSGENHQFLFYGFAK